MSDIGVFVAYAGLGLMAVTPIYLGSMSGLNDTSLKTKAAKEKVSREDAYWFPVIGSCVLFGFYLLFTLFSKEYINYLLTAYFGAFGAGSLIKLLLAVIEPVVPEMLQQRGQLRLCMLQGKSKVFDIKITWLNSIIAMASLVFTGYYIWSKNWIASNIFGQAFAISAISMIQLDAFLTGIILLSGLFFYDVFWVFGTNVMVTVAKSFDVPVKLLFPKNLFAPTDFALLGLGDIVIPGVFIALCLRFDQYLAKLKNPKATGVPEKMPYFKSCFVAYVIGLATTVGIMHTFKAAQPALLYLSPACILSVLGTALVRKELRMMLAFNEEDIAKCDAANGSNSIPASEGSVAEIDLDGPHEE